MLFRSQCRAGSASLRIDIDARQTAEAAQTRKELLHPRTISNVPGQTVQLSGQGIRIAATVRVPEAEFSGLR